MNLYKKNKSLFYGIVVIAISGIFAIILGNFKSKPEGKKAVPKEPVVLSSIMENKAIEVDINGYGRVSSTTPINLTSEVSGIVLSGNIDFLPGGNFQKGDLLLRVDDRQAKLDLLTAKSQLLNALASLLPELKIEFPDQYTKWQKYFDGFDFEHKLKDLPNPDNPKIKLYLARFNVYQLYFNVKNFEIRNEKYLIWAPFNGSIISVDSRPGSTARVGSVFGQIIKTDNMEVKVEIPATDLRWIKIGSKASINTEGNEVYSKGTVERIGRQLDMQTETVPVYVGLSDKQSNFSDGQFVEVNFPPINIEAAFKMPEKALYENSFIYIINNGKLKKTSVKPLHFQGDAVILGDGPSPGDTVVVQSLQGVASGMKVEARFEGNEDE